VRESQILAAIMHDFKSQRASYLARGRGPIDLSHKKCVCGHELGGCRGPAIGRSADFRNHGNRMVEFYRLLALQSLFFSIQKDSALLSALRRPGLRIPAPWQGHFERRRIA
jgi:hypothetical protein